MKEEYQGMTGLKETRLAVVFSGWVSLAVYESGVALEFYRLVKGEGVYGELKKEIGPVLVDVITGTSAGGMNGVFLANALVNRGDMRKLIPLWLEEGDFGKLLHKPLAKSPRSLLDGDYFRKKIFEALSEKRADASEESALQPFLDLFITGTNVDGCAKTCDKMGDREEESLTYRQVFHFRYRKDKRCGDGIINDFEGNDNLGRLAVAARVSASFPGAFEPVLVNKSDFAGIAKNLDADAYHMDGGVLDNKPLDLALEAIDARSADKKVDRILFFVDPDPKKVPRRLPGDLPEEYSPFEVVLKAVASIPQYQSLTTAFQDIGRYNLEIDDLRRTTQYYEDLAGEYRQHRDLKSSEEDSPEKARDNAKQGYVCPKDAATALYRAIEDGYLALRLGRDLSPGLLKCFTDGKEGIEELLAAELAGEKDEDLSKDAEHGQKTLAESICRIKRRILVLLDLKYPLRLCRYLTAQIRELYPDSDRLSNIPENHAIRITSSLNNLKQTISEFQARLELAQESQSETRALEIDKIINHLTLIRERIRDADAADRRETALDSFRALYRELKSREEVLENGLLFDELFKTVYLKLGNEIKNLKKGLSPTADSDKRLLSKITDGYWKLRDALEYFFQRDMLLYPQTVSSLHTGELQTIRYERISPDRAESFIPGLTAKDKLAGDMLAHFSGFLSEKWRGNDLVWGRLDSAEIIIRRLMPGPDRARERDRLISIVQGEILEEMSRMGLRVSEAENQRDARNLIGKEGLANLPGGKKVAWSLRSAATLLKIVRDSLAKSWCASLLKKALTVFNWLTLALSWLALFVGMLFHKRWGCILLKALAVLAIFFAGYLLGVYWGKF